MRILLQMIQVVSQFLQLRFADGDCRRGWPPGWAGNCRTAVPERIGPPGPGSLGREGWGVEIGAGASVAADEAPFLPSGPGRSSSGQGPGSTVPSCWRIWRAVSGAWADQESA